MRVTFRGGSYDGKTRRFVDENLIDAKTGRLLPLAMPKIGKDGEMEYYHCAERADEGGVAIYQLEE